MSFTLFKSLFTKEKLARETQLMINNQTVSKIDTTRFVKHKLLNDIVKRLVHDINNYMTAGQNPKFKGQRICTINVKVFTPLTPEESKYLNDRKTNTVTAVKGAVGGGVGVISRNPLAGFGAGYVAGKITMAALRGWDAGDIMVRLEARVNGGIGQQSREQAIVIKRSVYDKNEIEL